MRTRVILFFFVAASVLASCTHKEISGNDPDKLFSEAEEEFKDERYLQAIERYRDLKNRFPYSSRATDAELRIADAYFDEGAYLEAESAYEVFKELHPTHPRSDYVQYKIALSYFNEVPDNTARDLSAAYKAIENFNILLEKFPSSEFSEKGKDFLQQVRKKLAEHEDYVADFYYSRRHYLSASYRYAALLKDYSALGYDEEALYRLGVCYYHIHMFGNAKDAFRRFLEQFPKSSSRADVDKLLETISKTKTN
ncbi:MAG: outer membrane protein assembly factor BamD [Deltaproteobacteria bacterium]|nr:outer membrane protein assembly factor BamD [Deltaproteobacteria bacterium]